MDDRHAIDPPAQQIDALAQQIDEAVCRIYRDVDKVELWAGAVNGCAQAIPAYAFYQPANAERRQKTAN